MVGSTALVFQLDLTESNQIIVMLKLDIFKTFKTVQSWDYMKFNLSNENSIVQRSIGPHNQKSKHSEKENERYSPLIMIKGLGGSA